MKTREFDTSLQPEPVCPWCGDENTVALAALEPSIPIETTCQSCYARYRVEIVEEEDPDGNSPLYTTWNKEG